MQRVAGIPDLHSGRGYPIGAEFFTTNKIYPALVGNDIGASGLHVNTTDSAVRATYTETVISVRVESERSQRANKRLAKALLFQKLEMLKQEQMTSQEKVRWQQHWELERGNPVKTFKGDKFALATTKSC